MASRSNKFVSNEKWRYTHIQRFRIDFSLKELAIRKKYLIFVAEKTVDDMARLVVTVNDNAMLSHLRTVIKQLHGSGTGCYFA